MRNAAGEVFIVDTDKKGTLHRYYPPQRDQYEFPPLHPLPTAPAELLPCLGGKYVRYSGMKEYPEGSP